MNCPCSDDGPRADTVAVGLGKRDPVQPSDSHSQDSHPSPIPTNLRA